MTRRPGRGAARGHVTHAVGSDDRHDTAPRPRYGPPVRRILVLVALILAFVQSTAFADPGDPGPGPFRRTTPRASLERDAGGLVVGIPNGRAWGIESGLHPLYGAGPLTIRLAVDDPDVAEAFVRVAYYARLDARTRQLETHDSPFVRVGEDRLVTVELAPPARAVAYRVRVLGRLVPGAARSRGDAIRVRPGEPAAERGRGRPSLTRLEADLP